MEYKTESGEVMTTPNIEELIDRLYDWHNTSAEQNRLDMQKAADLLQSQAERIKELEAETRHKALVIATWRDKHDTLRAQLAAIAATEPVAWFDVRCEGCGYMTHHREHMGCVRAAKQHTHPMPAQGVAELVEALEDLKRQYSEHPDAFWDWSKARTALANIQKATP